MTDQEPMYWRVWFRNERGDERYFDSPGPFDANAIQVAHERFRAERGPDPMRGWWVDRWQMLKPTHGRWTRRGWRLDRPTMRFRLRHWLRRRLSR